MPPFSAVPPNVTKVLMDFSNLDKRKDVKMWPVHMCFLDFWCVCVSFCGSEAACCISLVDRVRKGRREGWKGQRTWEG